MPDIEVAILTNVYPPYISLHGELEHVEVPLISLFCQVQSFKEMIAMCLVKEPTKRPTAEKLLRHSFFKHARTSDYIYRHVLEGLPSLGERVKNLKVGIKVSQFVRVNSVSSC